MCCYLQAILFSYALCLIFLPLCLCLTVYYYCSFLCGFFINADFASDNSAGDLPPDFVAHLLFLFLSPSVKPTFVFHVDTSTNSI